MSDIHIKTEKEIADALREHIKQAQICIDGLNKTGWGVYIPIEDNCYRMRQATRFDLLNDQIKIEKNERKTI